MYLTYLLSSGQLTNAEVYVCITELLLGGVDTVRGELVAAAHTHKERQNSQRESGDMFLSAGSRWNDV